MPPSHAGTGRTGGPDLVLEPEPIREWLNQFRGILENLGRRRNGLLGLALAAGTIQLGDLTFATPLRTKLVDRLGQEEGGAA